MRRLLTRRRAMNLALGGWIAVGLSGCGQKGPLYFAPEEPGESSDDNEDNDEKNDEKKTDGRDLGAPRRHARRGPGPARIASGSREPV